MTIIHINDNKGRVRLVLRKNDILLSNVMMMMMNDENDERMNVNSFMWMSHIYIYESQKH
jgi:hypothetical protein